MILVNQTRQGLNESNKIHTHTRMHCTHLRHTTIAKSIEIRGKVFVRWRPAIHALPQPRPGLAHLWCLEAMHEATDIPNLVYVYAR